MASSDRPEILQKSLESLRIEPTIQIPTSSLSLPCSWEMPLGPFFVTMAHPDTIEDVKIKYSILSWCDLKDKSVDNVLATQATEYLTKKCFQAFRLAYLGGFENIESALQKILKLKSIFDDPEESLQSRYGCDGFTFVLECAYRHIMLSTGSSLSTVNSRPTIVYEDLSELSKATVKAIVVIFNRITGQCIQTQRALLEEAMKIGTEIAEWHHLHFQILRSIRRDDESTFRNCPPLVETNALGHAFRLDPKNKDYLISVCKTMFDFVKYGERPNLPYTIGSLSFPTRGNAIESLCSRLRELLEDDPTNSEASILAGSVFVSGRLPQQLRDSEFAKSCIDKVLELNPINAKALHRLGQWHLMQSKDIAAAKESFKKAMMADPLDYLPAIDYFWAVCADLREENLVTIDEALAKATVCKWPSHALLDIIFVKGCLLLGLEIEGSDNLAVLEFREAHRLSPDYFATRCHTLNGSVKRNSWRPEAVTLDKVVACLKNYDESMPEFDDPQLKEIIRLVEEVREKINHKLFRRDPATSGGWRDRSQSNEHGGSQSVGGGHGRVYSGGGSDCGSWRSRSRSESVDESGEQFQQRRDGSNHSGGKFNNWERNSNENGNWSRGGYSNSGGSFDRGGSSRRGNSSDRRGGFGNYGRGGYSPQNGNAGYSGDMGKADLDGNWRSAPAPKPIEKNETSESNGNANSEGEQNKV